MTKTILTVRILIYIMNFKSKTTDQSKITFHFSYFSSPFLTDRDAFFSEKMNFNTIL